MAKAELMVFNQKDLIDIMNGDLKKLSFYDPSGATDNYYAYVSKETAAVLLQTSNGNRKLSDVEVNKLKRDFNQGTYTTFTWGAGLTFSPDGHLNNGHHTLTALIKSDVEGAFLQISLGHTKKDTANCDTGKSRSLSETLLMSGMVTKEESELVYYVKNILNILVGKTPTNSSANKFDFPNTMVEGYLKEHKDRLEHLIMLDDQHSVSDSKGKKKDIVSCAKLERKVRIPVMYELIYLRGYDEKEVCDFVYGILGVNEPKIDNEVRRGTVDFLRRKLVDPNAKMFVKKYCFEQFYNMLMNLFHKYHVAIKTASTLKGLYDNDNFRENLNPIKEPITRVELEAKYRNVV